MALKAHIIPVFVEMVLRYNRRV